MKKIFFYVIACALTLNVSAQHKVDVREMADKVITHKLVAIDGEKIITRGVANSVADPAITRDDVLAVMSYKTVVLSTVYRVISTDAGFIVLILLPLIVMIISEIVTLMIQIKKEGGEVDRELEKESNP